MSCRHRLVRTFNYTRRPVSWAFWRTWGKKQWERDNVCTPIKWLKQKRSQSPQGVSSLPDRREWSFPSAWSNQHWPIKQCPPGKESHRKQRKTLLHCSVSSVWLLVKPYTVVTKTTTLSEAFLCAGFTKTLICVVSFQVPRNPLTQVLVLAPFHRYGNWVSGQVSTLCPGCAAGKCGSQDLNPGDPSLKAVRFYRGTRPRFLGTAHLPLREKQNMALKPAQGQKPTVSKPSRCRCALLTCHSVGEIKSW